MPVDGEEDDDSVIVDEVKSEDVYDYDEAYRDDVLRKLENSDIQF